MGKSLGPRPPDRRWERTFLRQVPSHPNSGVFAGFWHASIFDTCPCSRNRAIFPKAVLLAPSRPCGRPFRHCWRGAPSPLVAVAPETFPHVAMVPVPVPSGVFRKPFFLPSVCASLAQSTPWPLYRLLGPFGRVCDRLC